ncbi:DNA-directed RNA polymerase III subunit RPC3 [Cloeon dipterum]|uniref:DNA-directed RNA polymerase III subunit RPC3 n=1 Tax=Cloeon dipterum TaxID=197152 RepID=UPI0032208F3C
MSGTNQHSQLCSILLREAYGDHAVKVAMCLFRFGDLTFSQLASHSKLKQSKLQTVLKGLINFGLVKFEMGVDAKSGTQSNTPIYSLCKDRVLFLHRYIRGVPVFIWKFGTEGEIVLDSLMKCGHECASGIIFQATVRILKTESDQNVASVLEQIKGKLTELIQFGLIERAPSKQPENQEKLSDFSTPGKNYSLKGVDLPMMVERISNGILTLEDAEDQAILWQVSRNRVTQLLRDEMFAEALTGRVDCHAGNLVRVLLQLMADTGPAMSDVSNILHKPFIISAVKNSYSGSPLEAHLSEYLQILSQDSSSLVKNLGDASGGEYQITLKSAILELTWSALEKITQEQFGTKGARIFRVVRRHQFILVDDIQNHAMLPPKEAKQILYTLVGQNFVHFREMKLGTGSEAGKTSTSYYFFINLNQLVRMCLEKCYLAQFSASVRQNDIVSKYSHTIQKESRLTSLYVTLKDQGAPQEQLEDIAGMLTLTEREDLQKIGTWRAQLNFSEYDIDNSILLFELYIQMFKGKI